MNNLPRSNMKNSPFRYPGGKFYARKIILDEIPLHESYCEPFCGGASIFFAKEKSNRSILNDLDNNVINTLTHIRDNVEGLIELLDGVEATKENHNYYKNIFTPNDDLEKAFRWYFLNRTSYSGITREDNCYWGYRDKYSMPPKNWIPHLRTVSDKLQQTELRSIDFERLIDELPNGYFCFIDPPYYNSRQGTMYSCTFTNDDHTRLCDCLSRNSDRISFLLTYDYHEDIISMYDWCVSIEKKQWNYTIGRTDDQRNGLKLKEGFKGNRDKGNELFVKNFRKQDIFGHKGVLRNL